MAASRLSVCRIRLLKTDEPSLPRKGAIVIGMNHDYAEKIIAQMSRLDG